MAPLASDLHVTKPVIAAQFSALPFNDPLKLEAAARALASVK